MPEKRITKKEIDFLYEGIKVFYPFYFYPPEEVIGKPVVLVYRGLKRSVFLKYLLEITDSNDVRDALALLVYWRGLSDQELANTVPPEIAEMVEKLENAEKLEDAEVEKQISEIKRRLDEKGGVPKPEGLKAQETQIPREQIVAKEALASPIGIQITPETAKSLSEFISKGTYTVLMSPVKLATFLSGPSRYQESPVKATATNLYLVRGIKSSMLKRAFEEQARLIGITRKQMENLLAELDAAEKSYAYLDRWITLATRVGRLGITQTQVSFLLEPQGPEGDLAMPRGSFIGGLLGRAGQQLFGKASKFVLEKAAAKVIGAALAAPTGPLAPLVSIVTSWLAGKAADLVSWIKRNAKEIALYGGLALVVAGIALKGGVFSFLSPYLIGGGGAMAAGGGIRKLGGVGPTLTAASNATKNLVIGTVTLVVPSIGIPFIIALVSIPVVIAIILFIINAGAYVVPQAEEEVLLPPGGAGFGCDGAGNLVQAPNSELRLLPDTNLARKQKLCITPTEIVMHWSGGWNGVEGTYNTLVARDRACQFATDENTTLQMQQMWEKKVEWPICANSHNDFSVNIEMSGLCFSEMPGACAGVNTPPPESEISRTVDLVCWLKRQYNIKTIIGHYEIPDAAKDDPGRDFLHNTFIPRVNAKCPG